MSLTRRMLWLNGLAIVSVVLFHAAGWGYTAMFAWISRYMPPGTQVTAPIGSLWYYVLRFIDQLVVFSIPAFLFVSGSFIAISTGSSRRALDWASIRSRIKTLLIPYLIWTGVIALGTILLGTIPSGPQLLRWFLLGSSSPAYYFVPLLIQLYLLAPFITPLARNRPRLLLAFTGLVQLVVYALPYAQILGIAPEITSQAAALLPKWFFLVRVFWFALGIVVGFHQAAFKTLLSKIRWLLLVSIPSLIVLGVVEWEILFRKSGQAWIDHRETIVDGLLSISVIFTLMAFSKLVTSLDKPLENLGKKSFGVYLIHPIVMEYLARGLYHFMPALLSQHAILFLLLVGFGLGVPLVLMWLTRKSPLGRFYRYIYG